jgi:hypothetical protein
MDAGLVSCGTSPSDEEFLVLEKLLIEKLSTFGEKGYNKRPVDP